MPIIEPNDSTAPVYAPAGDYQIAKYLDLTKYLSLLSTSSLFFCRIDLLEDKFEGTFTKGSRERRILYWRFLKKSGFFDLEPTDEQINESVEANEQFDREFRQCMCTDCWNRFSIESAALWKIYSNMKQGIMIKSSINKLKKALEISDEEIDLSEIRYLNYTVNPKLPLESNSHTAFIHKHSAYHYEDEVRMLCLKIPESGWVNDWKKEEVEEGFYVKADLKELIEEIVISPYAPKWFFNLVENVTLKYGLDKPVVKSEMSMT